LAQCTLTIVTRIKPDDLDALDRLLGEIGHDVEKNEYLRFAEIASLHMAGIVIAAQDPRFPATLIFESNFDGTADEYLHALVGHGRAGIDAIYARCEEYPAESARTDATIIAYLRQHSLPAAAFFVGLPGQTVSSIRNAIAVREEINRFLDGEKREEFASGSKLCRDPRSDSGAFGARLPGKARDSSSYFFELSMGCAAQHDPGRARRTPGWSDSVAAARNLDSRSALPRSA